MNNGPIYMLNALWFRPDGGAKRYKEYLKAAAPISDKYGGRKLDSYVPEAAVIGDFDADLLFVVEWPSRKAFEDFVADPEFQAIRPLREKAITKSLLVCCRKVG